MTIFTAIPGATSATLNGTGLFTASTHYQVYREAVDDLTTEDSNILDFTMNAATGHADETDLLISYMTTPPTTQWATDIDTLIQGLIADGAWSSIQRMWMGASETAQASLLNWKLPSTDLLTVSGTSPVFTADRGYTGNASNIALTSAVNLSTYVNTNSSTLFFWNANGQGSGGGDVGENAASNFLLYFGVGGSIGGQLGATFLNPGFGGSRTGLCMITQNSSNIYAYVNGSVVSSTAQTTQAAPARKLQILGTNGGFSPAQMGCCGIAGYMDATQQLAFYNRLRTYMTARGMP